MFEYQIYPNNGPWFVSSIHVLMVCTSYVLKIYHLHTFGPPTRNLYEILLKSGDHNFVTWPSFQVARSTKIITNYT